MPKWAGHVNKMSPSGSRRSLSAGKFLLLLGISANKMGVSKKARLDGTILV